MATLSQQLDQLNSDLRHIERSTLTLASVDDIEEAAQDIHDRLKQIREAFELIRLDIEQDTQHLPRRKAQAEQISEQAAHLDKEIELASISFRQAQLGAKRASEAAKAQERELAFQSIVTPADNTDSQAAQGHRRQRTKQLTKDEILVNASSDVTSALRRTHDLLATELSRSRFAQETFDESTEALKELGEKYSDLDTILSSSRNLLSTLLRSQKSDTWYLETAFYILLTTLVWLVFRRILYGPFFKLPVFLWRVLSLVTHWTILKPLYYFLLLIGVIRLEPVPVSSRAEVSTSRPPLIIKPSASDFVGALPQSVMDQLRKEGVPAGSGGKGAKVGKDELSGQESEKIAKMVEQAGEGTRRGDGTVLQERGDIPKNPKKKVLEPEPPKDEL